MSNQKQEADAWLQSWSKLSIPSPGDEAQVWLCAISRSYFAISSDSLLSRPASAAASRSLPGPPAYHELGPGRIREIKLPTCRAEGASSAGNHSNHLQDVTCLLQKHWAATSSTAGDATSQQPAGPHMLLWSGGGSGDMTLNIAPFKQLWRHLTDDSLALLVSVLGAFHETSLQLLLVPTRLPYTSNADYHEQLIAAWFIPLRGFALEPVDACMSRWRRDMSTYLLEAERSKARKKQAENSAAATAKGTTAAVDGRMTCDNADDSLGAQPEHSSEKVQPTSSMNASLAAHAHQQQVPVEVEEKIARKVSKTIARKHKQASEVVLKVLQEHLKLCARRLTAMKLQDTLKRYPSDRRGLPDIDTKLTLAPGLHLGQCWPPVAYTSSSYTRPHGEHTAAYALQTFQQEFFRDCDCLDQGRVCPGAEGRKQLVQLQQHGVQRRLEIRSIPNMGWGVFANEVIEEDELITTYTGQILRGSNLVAKQEEKHHAMRWHYTFSPFPGGEGDGQHAIVDGTFMGNFSRFINHHCDPNCDVVLVCQPDSEAYADPDAAAVDNSSNASEDGSDADAEAEAEANANAYAGADADARADAGLDADVEDGAVMYSKEHLLGIQAKRRIMPGEQLTILYQANDESHTDLSRVPQHMRCHCGADNCRGWIFWEWMWDCDGSTPEDEDDLATAQSPVEGVAVETAGVATTPVTGKRQRSQELPHGPILGQGDTDAAQPLHGVPQGGQLQGQHDGCMCNAPPQAAVGLRHHSVMDDVRCDGVQLPPAQPSDASTQTAAMAAAVAEAMHTDDASDMRALKRQLLHERQVCASRTQHRGVAGASTAVPSVAGRAGAYPAATNTSALTSTWPMETR